jgi:hypothetical protein
MNKNHLRLFRACGIILFILGSLILFFSLMGHSLNWQIDISDTKVLNFDWIIISSSLAVLFGVCLHTFGVFYVPKR